MLHNCTYLQCRVDNHEAIRPLPVTPILCYAEASCGGKDAALGCCDVRHRHSNRLYILLPADQFMVGSQHTGPKVYQPDSILVYQCLFEHSHRHSRGSTATIRPQRLESTQTTEVGCECNIFSGRNVSLKLFLCSA